MKRSLIATLVITMLFLYSCGSTQPTQTETSTSAVTEQSEEIAYISKESMFPDDDCVFTETYAKTSSQLYVVTNNELFRFELDNISMNIKIPLPKNYSGHRLEGDYYEKGYNLSLCGISERWIIVSFWRDVDGSSRYCITFRITLDEYKAEVLDEGIYLICPWYNAQSGSLMFANKFDKNDAIVLETLNMDSGKRESIYQYDHEDWVGRGSSKNFHWSNTRDGGTAFIFVISSAQAFWRFIFIDQEDSGSYRGYESSKDLIDWYWDQSPDKATMGKNLYYIEENDEKRNFYRADIAGKNKVILRENTNITHLLSHQKRLFCVAWKSATTDEDQMGFYELDENGKVTQSIAHGKTEYRTNHGTFFRLRLFGDVILMLEQDYFLHSDGVFHALYDLKSGIVFPEDARKG